LLGVEQCLQQFVACAMCHEHRDKLSGMEVEGKQLTNDWVIEREAAHQ